MPKKKREPHKKFKAILEFNYEKDFDPRRGGDPFATCSNCSQRVYCQKSGKQKCSVFQREFGEALDAKGFHFADALPDLSDEYKYLTD